MESRGLITSLATFSRKKSAGILTLKSLWQEIKLDGVGIAPVRRELLKDGQPEPRGQLFNRYYHHCPSTDM